MSRYTRPIVLTHKNPISVDPSIPNSLESIRFAPISVEPPHTPPSHPPPTIALPLYTLTPEPTPITTLAAPTAPPSRTNHSMIDAPYRRARTLLRPLTFLTYQLDPRPPFCDTTTFSHPLRPTLMTNVRRTHSQTLNFTLSYHLSISTPPQPPVINNRPKTIHVVGNPRARVKMLISESPVQSQTWAGSDPPLPPRASRCCSAVAR